MPGARGPVNRLVDQQEVPHQQSPLHGFGGNAKGLHHKGEHKEGDDDDGQQGAEGVEQVGKDEVAMTVVDGARRDRGRHRNCGNAGFFRGHAEELRWWLVGQEPFPFTNDSRTGLCFLSLSKARRAASCSARFLVVPTPRASGLGPLPSATLTSTRKRLR